MRRIPSLVKEENSMFYLFTTRKESLQDEKITCSINAVSLSAALLGPGKATVSTIVKDWTDSFFEKSDDTNALMNSESTLHRIGNTIGHSTKNPISPNCLCRCEGFCRIETFATGKSYCH